MLFDAIEILIQLADGYLRHLKARIFHRGLLTNTKLVNRATTYCLLLFLDKGIIIAFQHAGPKDLRSGRLHYFV